MLSYCSPGLPGPIEEALVETKDLLGKAEARTCEVLVEVIGEAILPVVSARRMVHRKGSLRTARVRHVVRRHDER